MDRVSRRPADADDRFAGSIAFPGEFPYTRGIHPTMYRGRLWTMRQYAGFGTAEESNARYRYLIAQGTTGLSVAFDLPTQIGYDSDHPMARGEVGKVGVAIDVLDDMARLFEGIELEKVTTSMTINAPAALLLMMYVAVADRQGAERKALGGTIQNDILKEYISRGTYIFPPGPAMRLITDTFEHCAKELPQWNTISVSGYHMREAGCTAAQEVGFTFANALAYVKAAVDRGLRLETFGPRLSFFFAAHNDLLEEVAKFRAARRLWAKLVRERFGPEPRTERLRFHTQTAGVTLMAQQPDVNLVRVTVQALAATIGGTQSLHTNSLDEALGLPTEKAARLALRTQQVLAQESGIANAVDPFGGSYYVEWLTDSIEAEARKYVEKIDGMGGAVRAVEKGFQQRAIAEAAYRHQREVESEERLVVGINAFRMEEPPPPILKVEKALERAQVEKLKRFRKARDAQKVQEALARLGRAAESEENLLPRLVACTTAGATLGETCDILRTAFGEYRPAKGL